MKEYYLCIDGKLWDETDTEPWDSFNEIKNYALEVAREHPQETWERLYIAEFENGVEVNAYYAPHPYDNCDDDF